MKNKRVTTSNSIVVSAEVSASNIRGNMSTVERSFGKLNDMMGGVNVLVNKTFTINGLTRFKGRYIRFNSSLTRMRGIISIAFAAVSSGIGRFTGGTVASTKLSRAVTGECIKAFKTVSGSFKFSRTRTCSVSATLARLANSITSFCGVDRSLTCAGLGSMFANRARALGSLNIIVARDTLSRCTLTGNCNGAASTVARRRGITLHLTFIRGRLSTTSNSFVQASSS